MATEIKRIQLRRDTAANWISEDPVLASGEVGFDMTNHLFKIGDGILKWSDLTAFSDDIGATAQLTPKGPLQRIANELDVGFVGAHGDTELFPGAGNAHQDFDIVTVGGVRKLFVTHKVAGSTYGTDERIRIAEYNFSDDGSKLTPVAYSTELNAGHGQGFTAVVDGSNVTFYTTRKTFTSGNGGKGFSKIAWRGALTDDTDVTNYQLFGDSGSGHRYEGYRNATPCVSTDSKYVVLNVEIAGKIGNANKVVVYDRAEVEAAGDPLTVDPVNEFVEHIIPYEDSFILQGIACDGLYIYQCYKYIAPEHVGYITRTSLDGSFAGMNFASGMLDYYGPDGVRNDAAKGVMIRAEYEGITVREGKTYLGFVTGFVNDTPIVTATINGETMNLGAVGSTTGGTQTSPFSLRRWTRTELAATHGAWSAATTYTMGTNWTEKGKFILEIGDDDGRTGWFGNTVDWYGLHGSPLGAADAVADLSFLAHQALNINAHVALGGGQGKSLKAITLAEGEIRLHDFTYDGENSETVRMVRESKPTTKRGWFGTPGGPRVQVWDDDPANGVNQGDVQILAGDGVNSNQWTWSPDGLSALINAVSVLSVKPAGVGIGIATALDKLHVKDGNARFTQDGTVFFYLEDTTGETWALQSNSNDFRVTNPTTTGIEFNLSQAGDLSVLGFMQTGATTVASLPAAATAGAGARHFVTDANATTFASVVAGGGANGVPVYSDGTNWRIG